MINIKRIDTMNEFFEMINDQPYREEFGRHRGLFVYRGMPDASFHLETSLYLNCGDKSAELERYMLDNYKKYAVAEDSLVETNVWRELIIGQHYGLPTRLLDWTHSPLVAAHFATAENDLAKMTSHDCIIWRLDMKEIDRLLPQRYQDIQNKRGMDVFSFEMLHAAGCEDLESYDRDMKGNAMVVVEPPSIDKRIVNQYSFFSIIPQGMNNIENFLDENTKHSIKYVVSRNIRWEIRDLLDGANISERIFFPGLDGISKWMARHYYVRVDI